MKDKSESSEAGKLFAESEKVPAYADGTWRGAAPGFGGEVIAFVMIEGGIIRSIEVDVSDETPELAELPRTEIPKNVIVRGDMDVDAISGATVTSEAIKSAIAVALDGAASKESAFMKPGRYTVKVQGYGGEMSVAVQLSETGIESVDIESMRETPGIGAVALKPLSDEIVACQSIAVDAISGATVTSAALKLAVGQAIGEAGGNKAAFYRYPLPSERRTENIETDVLIVGSGIAGFCAGIAALEKGARVVMLEKLGICGGTSAVSGSAFMGTMSRWNRERGDESEMLAQFWYERQEKHYNVSYPQLLYVAQRSGVLIDWIADLTGLEFVLGYGGGSPVMWSHRMNELSDVNGLPLLEGAAKLFSGLIKCFCERGGELMLNTRCIELIQDDAGEVCGAKAISRDAEYTIKATGGVVLATGGYEADPDMVAAYAPNATHWKPNGATAGDTGDAIRLALNAGARIACSGYLMSSWNHIHGLFSYGLDAMMLKHKEKCLELNGRLERYYNENTTPIEEQRAMARDGSGEYYVLFDSSLGDEVCAKLDKAAADGVIFKAGSLDELAQMANKSHVALAATVRRWNDLARKGVDDDFGNKLIAPLDSGPYYLCRVYELSIGSYGGPVIDLDTKVLKLDGTPIPGLYAAGECANGEFYYRHYVSGGSSFAMCSVFGKTAGENAAARALVARSSI
jgi:fumarate reductase flavoprotein subunit